MEFWKWFFLGLSDRSGLQTLFIDRWCIIHIAIGFISAWYIEVCIHDAAQTVLLPLAGIFIGLSFAWAGNTQALLQQKEIREFFLYLPDKIEAHLYTFQLAILVILVTLCAWGLAGLKVFLLPIFQTPCIQLLIETCLYFLASLTLRECWNVVYGSQILIFVSHRAQEEKDKKR